MNNTQNIEFKSYCKNVDKAIEICKSIGAEHVRDVKQTDIYYFVPKGRLKIRNDGEYRKYLIFYERLNSSKVRSCSYEKIDISSNHHSIENILEKSLQSKITVEKNRTIFKKDHFILNIDEIKDIGNFLEIEVIVDERFSQEKATQEANNLMNDFKIPQSEIVSFSYADLIVMHNASLHWHNKLNSSSGQGKLFLIDGCSCSGKTSLSKAICKESNLNLNFVPRYCTRERRENEKEESEYIFVTHEEFRKLAFNGEFIEYRDFEFGMSYGLPWEKATIPLMRGMNALGIINLGNIVHVKRVFPESVTILIDAPIDTIHRRLLDRGYNNKTQIDERLENAKSVSLFKSHYDYIVNNDNNFFEQSMAELRRIIELNTQIKYETL